MSQAPGIPGSRKIKLNRSSFNVTAPTKPHGKDLTAAGDNVIMDSSRQTIAKSNIVDSAFSNFVAKKMEEIGQEKLRLSTEDQSTSKEKEKKHKHKKAEKHKKHKHKDKDGEKKSRRESRDSDSEGGGGDGGGFFAKERFLAPGETEEDREDHSRGNNQSTRDSDSGGNTKSKKHKKHKKGEHKHKKHKHDRDKKDAEIDNSKKTNSSPKNIFADKFEKQIESKLNSLKENLTKKHKALEDLNKELCIPEKKIKMMTELTLSDKYKFEEEKKNTMSKSSEMKTAGQKAGVVNSGSAFSELAMSQKASSTSGKEVGEDRSVQASAGGSLTVQLSNQGNDSDGFRAMKSRKEKEEEASAATTNTVSGGDNTIKATTGLLAKKMTGMKLGLKLSENSFSLISSGIKIENDPKKKNREEGEITDSQESSPLSSSSSADSDSDSAGEKKDSKNSSKKISKDKKKRRRHSREKNKKHSRSRSPGSSSKKRHRRSRSRSRSYDEHRGVWKSKSRRRRSRSKDRRSQEREKRRSRSREREDRNFYYNDRYRVRRSRSRERDRSSDLRFKIDKAKLREIAMRNALTMMGGDAETVKNLKPDQIAALKAGGKSVEELTNFCKKISEKDPNDSSSDEETRRRMMRAPSDDEGDTPFIHHPFKVNPQAANIAMNIRNARQLPVTSFADRAAKSGELRLQFPVSSGSQHKTKEDEWTPVEKPKTTPPAVTAPPPKPFASATNSTAPQKLMPKPGALMPPPPNPPPIPPAALGFTALVPDVPPEPVKPEDRVFPEFVEGPRVNISDIVSERLSAMRKLQYNPNDVQAMGAMYKSQEAMKTWAQRQEVPGQFTGSTELKILSQKELQGTGNQAWAKKDQFHRAAPVKGGIGKLLLQKMGWREGTGLGKEETGNLEPLNLDIKVDRKGLVSADEAPVHHGNTGKRGGGGGNKQPVMKDLSGKHPVSALMELCKRKKWPQPVFEQVFECGPPHKKNFVFKARVNDTDYQPTIASSNKKMAKAQAANVVLQHFGLVPKDQLL